MGISMMWIAHFHKPIVIVMNLLLLPYKLQEQ